MTSTPDSEVPEPDDGGDPAVPEPAEGPEADEDAAWAAIVANFGERATLDAEAEADPTRTVRWTVARPLPEPTLPTPDDGDGDGDGDEHYTPPPPPPATLPRGPRLLAWLGVFGVPAITVLCLLARITVAGWVAFLLFVGFLSGFGYLVATMRKHDDLDPGDDGAVV